MSTETPEIVHELDTAIVHVSALNTRQPTEKDVKASGLLLSIKNHKQTTPGLARPHPDKPGEYELAAGACRRTACHALGIPFKVIIREMTNDEFEDTILIENLQREDPDAEAEAILIGRRLAEGADPSEIAARYGKDEKWVKRRMKLLEIIPALKKKMLPGKELEHFTTEMRERVGSLPAETQESFTDDWQFRNCRTMAGLQDFLSRSARKLENCDWLQDPDTFVPGCGPGCATDTNASLFPEEGKGSCGKCLNGACFSKRYGLAVDKAIDTALAGRQITDVVLFETSYSSGLTYQGKQMRPLDQWDFKKVYKTSKGRPPKVIAMDAMVGLDVTNRMKPRLIVIERIGKDNASGGSTGTGTGVKKESREDRITGKRLALINKEIESAITQCGPPDNVDILQLVVAFGLDAKRTSCHSQGDHDSAWDNFDGGDSVTTFGYGASKTKRPRIDVLWEQIQPILKTRIQFFKNGDLLGKHKVAEMKRIATLIGFDYDTTWIRICTTDAPVPKSWGPGFDPITLKKATGKPEKAKDDPSARVAKPAKKAAKKTAKKKPQPAGA